MSQGRVYVWVSDSNELLEGRVEEKIVRLPGLTAGTDGKACLTGRFAHVRNGGCINVLDSNGIRATPIGDAQPDDQGNFFFDPARGGSRMDKRARAEPEFQWRCIQASHFGEVNTYYHLDQIASYVETLLDELGAPRLPQVVAVVNAHHAAVGQGEIRDGERRKGLWKAFQGGHYRLPGRCHGIQELLPLSETGEIHLGPGRRLMKDGALVRAFGPRYRANASHNAATIYHEYGHHIARHTADFRGNARKPPHRQSNAKVALDEGTSDYWAAVMLKTPRIWAWHRRHDAPGGHPRSLVSHKTMDDFVFTPGANPHTNGTIWAAALWDLRSKLDRGEDNGARKSDLLVLKTLLSIGQNLREGKQGLRRVRAGYSRAAAALLEADEALFSGNHRSLIVDCLSRRKILLAEASAREETVDWWRQQGKECSA